MVSKGHIPPPSPFMVCVYSFRGWVK